MEASLRRKREEIELLEKGGANEDDINAAKAKYRALSNEYAAFSKAMNLPRQRERISIDGRKGVDVSFGKPAKAKEKTVEPTSSPTNETNKTPKNSSIQPKINEKTIENSSENDIIKPEVAQRREEARIRNEVIPTLKTDTVVPRQRIHRQGTKEYEERKAILAGKGQYGPAYVTISDEEILQLVNKHKGTGKITINKKKLIWNNQETIIDNDIVVGVCVNNRNGVSAETTVFKIHYSKKGMHIVPDYPSKKKVQ